MEGSAWALIHGGIQTQPIPPLFPLQAREGSCDWQRCNSYPSDRAFALINRAISPIEYNSIQLKLRKILGEKLAQIWVTFRFFVKKHMVGLLMGIRQPHQSIPRHLRLSCPSGVFLGCCMGACMAALRLEWRLLCSPSTPLPCPSLPKLLWPCPGP